jgi:hypothetical protein
MNKKEIKILSKAIPKLARADNSSLSNLTTSLSDIELYLYIKNYDDIEKAGLIIKPTFELRLLSCLAPRIDINILSSTNNYLNVEFIEYLDFVENNDPDRRLVFNYEYKKIKNINTKYFEKMHEILECNSEYSRFILTQKKYSYPDSNIHKSAIKKEACTSILYHHPTKSLYISKNPKHALGKDIKRVIYITSRIRLFEDIKRAKIFRKYNEENPGFYERIKAL